MADIALPFPSASVLRLPRIPDFQRIVVSDIHFPRSDNHPKYLHEFLYWNSSSEIIFLGDTHEGYTGELGDLNPLQRRVMNLLEARKADGIIIIDINGNHDSYKRQAHIEGHVIDKVEYHRALIVQSSLGPTLLVHGDSVESALYKKYDRSAFQIASQIRVANLSALELYSRLTAMAVSAGMLGKKKTTVSAAAALARANDATAVLTGHTHKPTTFHFAGAAEGILYGNTGCWVGGMCTAMVQHHDGRWELIDWRKQRNKHFSGKPAGLEVEDPYKSYEEVAIRSHQWQQIQHGLYSQNIILDMMEESSAVGKQMGKDIERIQIRAKEKLHELRDKQAKLDQEIETRPLSTSPVIHTLGPPYLRTA